MQKEKDEIDKTKSHFNVTLPSKLPVVKVTTLLELLLHFRLVPIVWAV